jgi:hypothetical protein
MHGVFCCEGQMEKVDEEDVNGKIMIKLILETSDGMEWTELIWLRIRNIDRFLLALQWNFGFNKMF